MHILLLAIASVCYVVRCSPPMPFPHDMPIPMHRFGLGHLGSFEHPQFLLPNHPSFHPRRIIIIRRPPGAGFPFSNSPLGRVLDRRTLPDSFMQRGPRPFRTTQHPLLRRRISRGRTFPVMQASKYGYHRPDFYRSGSGRRPLSRLGRDHSKPFEGDWRHWFQRSSSATGDRNDIYTDGFGTTWSGSLGDFTRGESRRNRDNRGGFSGDFVGMSRRFDSPGSVRRPVPRRAPSDFGIERNALNRNDANRPMNSARSSRRQSVDPRTGEAAGQRRVHSRGQRRGQRRGPRRGSVRPRITVRKPILKEAVRNIADNAVGVLKSMTKSGADVEQLGSETIKQTMHPAKEADVIDLTRVDYPANKDNFKTTDMRSKGMANSVIDLRNLEKQSEVPRTPELVKDAMKTIKTAVPLPSAEFSDVPLKTISPGSMVFNDIQAPETLVGPDFLPPGKSVGSDFLTPGESVGPDFPPSSKPEGDILYAPPPIEGGPGAPQVPPAALPDFPPQSAADPDLPVNYIPPPMNHAIESKNIPDVAPSGAGPVIDVVPRRGNIEAAGREGAGQAIDFNPLPQDISIVDLGRGGKSGIGPGADLSGLGNVDVLTLSSDGFAALEKAIHSGQAISADYLDSIISTGGASGGLGAGDAGAGANIVLIDHPSVNHDAGVHTGHGVSTHGDHSAQSASPHGDHGSRSASPHGDHGSRSASPHGDHGFQSASPHGDHGFQSAPSHGPHGPDSVGIVGDPVGGVEANGATDIVGLFALPSGSKFPNVPKSVSSIPSSIGNILNGVPKGHGAHGAH